MDEMNTRDRLRAVLNFQPFDRLPVVEWAGWWTQTLDRWRGEGLPGNLEGDDIRRHLGMDVLLHSTIRPRGPACPGEKSHGAGVCWTMDDYERLRPDLFPRPAIDAEGWRRWAAEHRTGRAAMWFSFEGFFWFPRTLLGIEKHLFAFYDQAELMHRMNADLADWMVGALDELCAVCEPDFMTFAEDLSYNHGPMLSKKLFDEFLLPYYRRIVPRLKDRGILAIVDSDGDVAVPAFWFEEAGLDGILPLERQAGVDMAQLRRDHPRMRFLGGYDKMVMNRGEAAMRREFERLLPVAARGGYVISCDHQTPPGVSLEDYRLYLRLFREYAEQAGRMSRTQAGH